MRKLIGAYFLYIYEMLVWSYYHEITRDFSQFVKLLRILQPFVRKNVHATE